MAVGLPAKTTYVDGDVFSASDINDTNGTLNLVGQTTNFYAGKNKIINGDFRINQRSFTSLTASGYGFDRWNAVMQGDGTATYSTQAFTLGTAPVAGYEGTNFARFVTTGQTSSAVRSNWDQRIESVRTFAGQTVTFSFWAMAASGTPQVTLELVQNFGSGGSPSAPVTAIGSEKRTLSTSWARYSMTVAIPSIAGKTLGTSGDHLAAVIWVSAGSDHNTRSNTLGIQSNTFDIWGVQVEAGSTATAFQTATGTLQGELAACQRYLPAFKYDASNSVIAGGYASATNVVNMVCPFPVTARVAATGITVSNVNHIQWASTGNNAASNATFNVASANAGIVALTVTAVSGQGGTGLFNNSAGLLLFTGCEL